MRSPKGSGSRIVSLLVVSAAVVVAVWPAAAFAATQPRLGTIANPGYTVVAGSTITNTGSSVVTGNLALSPGTAVTGMTFSTSPGPGVVTGSHDVANGPALQAQSDLTIAYTDAANAISTADLSGQDLGNKNLGPGVYSFSSSAQLTGPLTLSGNGVFIFKIGSTLTTASASSVLLANGAQACAVFWQVGSSATLGGGTSFQGNLMAQASITLVTAANILTGRALARTGALTLDTNRITPPTGPCTVAATTTTPPGTTVGLPNTGGPPPQPALPWWPLAIAGTIGAILIGVRRRAHHS